MRAILITSSVLIAVLLVLRLLFRRTISSRVQYALWALVLARLLLPVSLPGMSLSVLNAGTKAQTAVAQSMTRRIYVLPMERTPAAEIPTAAQTAPGEVVLTGDSMGYPVLSQDGQTVTKYAQRMSIGEVLGIIWKTGIALMAAFFLWTNLRFWRRLRKNRKPYPVADCALPVYLCEGLPSPCLFGPIRPAIYLTPAALHSPESLRHIIAHEATHARHLDPLWALLRCVCLTVYWFNPLVWVAAVVSKTDCELACDEGALGRLEEGERLPYGQTLLSLIPVGHGPANPLLSATTMAAGKRQLKDRITRIAQRHRSGLAAVLAVAVLTLGVSACTFTGAKNTPAPVTAEDLAYFNEVYFNGEGLNIRNQFLSSLYETPAEIDLFELFYCGIPDGEIALPTTSPSDVERELVYGDIELPCPDYKLTIAQMEALLLKYTGLEHLVGGTDQVGIDHFTYLGAYEAYYWAHGDTNYWGGVYFSAMEREGELIHLYYEDTFRGDGWKCVTLRAVEDGYHFVSNRAAEAPVIPTALPQRDPVLTIPLDDLAPYQPPEITVERHNNDRVEELGSWSVGEHVISAYQSTDGNTYAAVVYEEGATDGGGGIWDVGCFLTLPDNSFTASFFTDLLVQDGIIISYEGMRMPNNLVPFHDYYTVTEDGTPFLLARVHGAHPQQVDMDGDGVREVVTDSQILFQREGAPYFIELPDMLAGAWPEMTFWNYAALDGYARSVTARGFVSMPDWGEGHASFRREIYFTGESLLVYAEGETVDHVLQGGSQVPSDVLEHAKTQAQADYQAIKAGGESVLTDQNFDDWRISELEQVNLQAGGFWRPDLDIALYRYDLQLHCAVPGDVVLAGGVTLDEKGWYGGHYSHQNPYLLFHLQGEERILLDSDLLAQVDVTSPAFHHGLTLILERNGLTWADSE